MSEKPSKVWYKEPWPWILMAGPAIVVVAAFATFYIAQINAADLVSDDYYQDGKHINLDIKRDQAAFDRHISAQVLINPNGDAAKILLSGNFDPTHPLKLTFLHPAKRGFDQSVELKMPSNAQPGSTVELNAALKPLPQTQHWYVRLEDESGKWRVEDKWIVNQGNAVTLKPMSKVVQQNNAN